MSARARSGARADAYVTAQIEAGCEHMLVEWHKVAQADHREVVMHTQVGGEFKAIIARVRADDDQDAMAPALEWVSRHRPDIELVSVAWVERFQIWDDADARDRADDVEVVAVAAAGGTA
jgi:hypothetical protein